MRAANTARWAALAIVRAEAPLAACGPPFVTGASRAHASAHARAHLRGAASNANVPSPRSARPEESNQPRMPATATSTAQHKLAVKDWKCVADASAVELPWLTRAETSDELDGRPGPITADP